MSADKDIAALSSLKAKAEALAIEAAALPLMPVVSIRFTDCATFIQAEIDRIEVREAKAAEAAKLADAQTEGA